MTAWGTQRVPARNVCLSGLYVPCQARPVKQDSNRFEGSILNVDLNQL